MAFLKSWASRSFKPLELRDPGLIAGEGFAYRGDALALASTLPKVDLAYLDPPYNQHRYFRTITFGRPSRVGMHPSLMALR